MSELNRGQALALAVRVKTRIDSPLAYQLAPADIVALCDYLLSSDAEATVFPNSITNMSRRIVETGRGAIAEFSDDALRETRARLVNQGYQLAESILTLAGEEVEV